MLIICPKCFAKYEIDVQQFQEETHIFQCSNCGKRFEERVHFDDEKNENQQVVPPAFITEQPVIAPLSESDYISSNRATMDFSPQSSVVLPEEFTPVSDSGPSIGHRLVFSFIFLFVLILVGASIYVWMNRIELLKKYPDIQKAINLVTAPVSTSSVAYSDVKNEELPMESEAMPKAQEIILTPIEQKMQEEVKNGADVAEHILPVKATDVVEIAPVILNEGSQSPVLKMPSEEVMNVDLSADLPVLQEAVLSQEVPNVPTGTMEPNVPVLPHEGVQKVKTELPIEEEIILEDISIPDEIVIPDIEQAPTEPTISGKDVQIRDVSFKYDQSETGPQLFVQGVISNLSDKGIKLPQLQVQLFDSNGTLLGVKDLPYGEAQMPAKSDEFFFYELSEIPTGTVAKIEVVVKG